MNEDTEIWIAEYQICDQTQKVPKERVVSRWKEVKRSFERIYIDFFLF